MSIINDKFPGRSDYVGPKAGWFGLLHHGILFEESHDVMERVDYVGREKPKGEIAIRLHNMIYLGAVADTCAKRATLDADYKAKCAPLDAEIFAYISINIPDCAWDGTKLVFTT